MKLRIHNKIFSQVSAVLSGSVLGQGVTVLAIPLLTRIYTPSIYGEYMVYFSLLSLFSTIIALRLDIAIPIPKKNSEAFQLLAAAVISIFILCLLAECVIILGNTFFSQLLNLNTLKPFLWLLPISLFVVGIYNTFSYLCIRNRHFKRLGIAKMTQGLTQSTAQVCLGLLHFTSLGLITGQIFGHGSASLILSQKITFRYLLRTRFSEVLSILKRYWRFPALSAPASLINAMSLHLPTLGISICFGVEKAAWYGLVAQVIAMPLALIGQASGQVYLGEGAQLKHQKDYKALKQLYLKMMRNLMLLGLPLILIVLGLGPSLFKWVFGNGWYEAGVVAQCLIVMLCLEFAIVGPSQNFNLFERQDVALYWNLLFLTLHIFAFLPAVIGNASFLNTVLYISVAKSLGYITMALLNWYVIQNVEKELDSHLCAE